jgi:hypothetical protein
MGGAGGDVAYVPEPVLARGHRGLSAVGGRQGRRHLADGVRLAAAGVVRGDGSGIPVVERLQGHGVRGGHVPYMDEVAALAAVLVDPGRLAAREGGAEGGGDAGVGGVAGHPGAADVVVAQGHGPALGGARPGGGEMFLGQLGGGVHIARVGRRVLADEARRQGRAALWAAGFRSGLRPGPVGRGGQVSPARGRDSRSGPRRRPPWSGEDEPAGSGLRHRGEQDGGAEVVDGDVVRVSAKSLRYRPWRPGDTRRAARAVPPGRPVRLRVGTPLRLQPRWAGRWGGRRQQGCCGRWGRRGQCAGGVQDDGFVAAFHEGLDDVRTDEARATRHKHTHAVHRTERAAPHGVARADVTDSSGPGRSARDGALDPTGHQVNCPGLLTPFVAVGILETP